MWQGMAGSMASEGANSAMSAATTAAGSYAGWRMGQMADKKAFERQVIMMQNAHQWEVDDLRKAGLNPILSAGGGGAHASPVSNTSASAATSGAQIGMQLGEQLSRIRANNAASARDMAAAKETDARRITEYGALVDEDEATSFKNDKGETVVTPFKGLKREQWDSEKLLQKHRAEILMEDARRAGFENIESAARAGLYEGEKGKWIKGVELFLKALKDGVDIYKGIRGGQAEKEKRDFYYERSRE